jgi:membrane-associated phospholipid phosphatase
VSSGRTLIVIAGLIALALSVAFVDLPLAQFIADNTNPTIETVGSILETAGESHWVLIYAVLTVAIAWRSWRSVSHRHVALFTAVAASGIAANIIKVLVCRPRPPLFLQEGLVDPQWFGFLIDWSWNSFPSGHATTGIAIAIAGSAAWPRASALIWVVGLSIAFGRLLYNVHYLSDVIGGILLGAVISWWCVQTLTVFEERRARDSAATR